MEFIHFAIKYTPFWAVPCAMICGFYGYIYWLKSFKFSAYSLLIGAFVSGVAIIFYLLTGGPQGSVQVFMRFVEDFKAY